MQKKRKGNDPLRFLCVGEEQTFKEVEKIMGISSSTMIRRFKDVTKSQMVSGVRLLQTIGMDVCKGDTDVGLYQLIYETHLNFKNGQ